MQTKVAITGAAGFIGSNLIEALLEDGGYYVKAIDNLSMGKLENLAPFMEKSNFEFHKIDVRNLKELSDCCKGVQVIVHLAAYKIPRYGNTIDTLEVNCKGMWNVLGAAKEHGCEVVSASTSEVYGKSNDLPFSETGNLLMGPSTTARWSYAVSKLFDEHLCFAYQQAYNIPVTSLRFFGSYGPRGHLSWWSGPQTVFIMAALKDQEMEIHGDGKQTRTFTYVSDTVAGIKAAIEKKEARGHIFNIGSTFEISIIDLAVLISRLVKGREGMEKFKFIPYKAFVGNYEDVRRRVPDVSKAYKILGFTPKITLEEGLKKTIQWQKKILGL
jgi:UDP-glucose 4-epimerase